MSVASVAGPRTGPRQTRSGRAETGPNGSSPAQVRLERELLQRSGRGEEARTCRRVQRADRQLTQVGGELGEFHLATKALGLERGGLCHQRVPPGRRLPNGHTHEQQEELYVVVRGSGRMTLDDEIVDIREWPTRARRARRTRRLDERPVSQLRILE